MDSRKSFSHWLQRGFAAAAIIGMAGAAQAATVTFSDIMDGDGSPALFDTGTTVAAGNTLNIGLNEFRADRNLPSALDTLSMTITAPAGYTITSITYTERGEGGTPDGVALATGSIVADGGPINFPTVMYNLGGSGTWEISPGEILIDNKDSISVSITNSLLAVPFGSGANDAWIEKTEAFLTVNTEISEVPLPAAGWMLGTALISLVIGARRRRGAATT